MDQAQSGRTITFAGAQTVANVEAACERLREAAIGCDSLVVDLRGVTEADLAFLQILIAARRTCDAAGRPSRFHAPHDGAVVAAASRGGIAVDWLSPGSPAQGDPQ